jgi:hypothetical protein
MGNELGDRYLMSGTMNEFVDIKAIYRHLLLYGSKVVGQKYEGCYLVFTLLFNTVPPYHVDFWWKVD